jgi:DNA-binding winged helix-turn-helix (wHTH) protein
MVHVPHDSYEFGRFLIDVGERVLLRDGEDVALTQKAFDVLLALVERSGHVVEKEELLRRVWPDSFVEEGNLSQNIYTLRKILGADRDDKPYIQTVPRRGYRFAGGVKVVRAGAGGAAGADQHLEPESSAQPLAELEDGPDAFARLAEGPPPPEFKVFLAGAGREA